jgi:hypothetical protein
MIGPVFTFIRKLLTENPDEFIYNLEINMIKSDKYCLIYR